MLYNWKAKIEADCASTPTQDEKAELIALRKENKRPRLEQEILKKASAFFASRALPPSPSCMEESDSTIYFFRYDAKKKALNVNYRHNYVDPEKQIDTYKTHKIPEAYYEKYHTSREAMIKEADDILYGHLLPLYFDRNSKGIVGSRFSINKLGTYTVEYHF